MSSSAPILGSDRHLPGARSGVLHYRGPVTSIRLVALTLFFVGCAGSDAEPALDRGHIVAVEVVMPTASGNAAGSIWMSDLELADR